MRNKKPKNMTPRNENSLTLSAGMWMTAPKLQEIISRERELVADTLDTFYVKKAMPYLIASEQFTTLWSVAQAKILTTGARGDEIRHWLAHKVAGKDTFKEEVNKAVAYLREREIALIGEAELMTDENHPVVLGSELWEALTIFEETNPNSTKESEALEALRVILNKQKTTISERIHYSRQNINVGGNSEGMRDWRSQLAKEVIELECEYPNYHAYQVRSALLDRYTEKDTKTGERKLKAGLSDDDKQKVHSLNSKTAQHRPDNYIKKLKEAYQRT